MFDLNSLFDPPSAEDQEDAAPVKRFLEPSDCTHECDETCVLPCALEGKIHQPQWDFIKAPDEDCLVLVGRQGAKTTSALLRAIEKATRNPGTKVLYVAYDLSLGRDAFYEPCLDWLVKLGWKFEANGTRLKITLENKSIIQVKSADDMRATGRLRGRTAFRFIICDEVQELEPSILRKLVVEVLGPMAWKKKGNICLLFTPPDICVGWLWEEYSSGRWRLLQWSVMDNPHLPLGVTENWLKVRGLSIDHPIARRELMGLWEPNTERQVYDFTYQLNIWDGQAATNEPATLPVGKDFPPDEWAYGFGGDIGWEHPSSVTFAAWNLHDPQKRIYEVLTLGGPKWTIEYWFKVLMDFSLHIKRKPFRSAIMDNAGSGGLNVIHSVEERLRRMGLPITIAYKPANVQASVGLTNDQLRTGRLLLRSDSPLLDEIPKTVWKEGTNRQEIDKGKFDPDGLDGLRYMVWGATNYRAKAPPEPPSTDPNQMARDRITAAIKRDLNKQNQRRFNRRK